jgi:hypothetical protein
MPQRGYRDKELGRAVTGGTTASILHVGIDEADH